MALASDPNRTQVVIAVLGMIGVVATAVAGNWDKMFGHRVAEASSSTTNVANSTSIEPATDLKIAPNPTPPKSSPPPVVAPTEHEKPPAAAQLEGHEGGTSACGATNRRPEFLSTRAWSQYRCAAGVANGETCLPRRVYSAQSGEGCPDKQLCCGPAIRGLEKGEGLLSRRAMTAVVEYTVNEPEGPDSFVTHYVQRNTDTSGRMKVFVERGGLKQEIDQAAFFYETNEAVIAVGYEVRYKKDGGLRRNYVPDTVTFSRRTLTRSKICDDRIRFCFDVDVRPTDWMEDLNKASPHEKVAF